MLIRIGEFDITECCDGVFYKKLSGYPDITAWEMQTVLDFIRYEKDNGRTCRIEADREIIQPAFQDGPWSEITILCNGGSFLKSV